MYVIMVQKNVRPAPEPLSNHNYSLATSQLATAKITMLYRQTIPESDQETRRNAGNPATTRQRHTPNARMPGTHAPASTCQLGRLSETSGLEPPA